MKAEQLLELTQHSMEEMKATDIQILDVTSMTSITDYMIICTARSSRHAKSIADFISMKAKENKVSFVHTEGEQEGEWILVDLGDVVAHVMQANAREFYSIEDLWQPIQDMRDSSANG